MSKTVPVDLQRKYYEETAALYEEMHMKQDDEHYVALSVLRGLIDHYEISSILDIGTGTGRALRYFRQHCPDVRIVGVEPVEALRDQAYAAGLSAEQVRDGDANKLSFDDGSFDLVCEFGVLHHVPWPATVVSEMLRVSRKAVYISDSNNYGQGRFASRMIKHGLRFCGLWRLAVYIKTGGKGYSISEGDGLGYSYSPLDNWSLLAKSCSVIHTVNTTGGGPHAFFQNSHVAVLGIKR